MRLPGWLGGVSPLAWRGVGAAGIGASLGALDSLFVNDALYEISTSPVFAMAYGMILLLLGSLMIWRKMWEKHDSQTKRMLILAFSLLVLCSGISCFLLEKDWFNHIPFLLKLALYVLLGISLSFTISCSLIDLTNFCIDRCSREYQFANAWCPHHVFLALAGAVLVGAAVGFMFGVIDVEDNFSRMSFESIMLFIISSICGALTGVASVLVDDQWMKNIVDERSQLNNAT